MRYVLGLAVAAMLVSPVYAAWQGDFIYAAQDRYNSDGSSVWRYGIAVCYLDYDASFAGGKTHSGYDQSEPLCQNDGLTGGDAFSITRGVVNYDSDTALILCTNRWGSSSTKSFINQIEYRCNETMESQGLVNPGRVSTYSPTVQPITDGGISSGRIQMAVTAEGYDPNGVSPTAIDPRLRLDATLGADGLTGADCVTGLAKDETGNLYVSGRVKGSGNARVYKLAGPGALANAAGQRAIDQLGAPALVVSKVTPVSWFTGVAASGNEVYVTDYTVQSVDAYDSNGAGLIASVDLSVPGVGGLIPDIAYGLLPEDVRVDPTYAGPGVRLVVQVLDETATSPIGRIDGLILDLVGGAFVAGRAFGINGAPENGHYSYTSIDWLEISPGGDLLWADTRGSNDVRAVEVDDTEYAKAGVLAAPGAVTLIQSGFTSAWNDRCFDMAKGGAFMDPCPEPASMALLVLGGLALIRRRK